MERGAVAPRCGNLKTRTDARGITASYQYDAGNRLTGIDYGDQTVALTWDSCANGIGRLCQISDASGSTTYAYDSQGRLARQTQRIGGINLVLQIGYDSTGHPVSLTLPSGKVVGYGWSDGKLSDLTIDGSAQLSAIAYQPFGPVSGWTWGNGQAQVRRFDLAGRLKETTLGNDAASQVYTRGLSYDAAGRVVALVDGLDTDLGQTFDYDGLDRLVASRLNGSSPTTLSYAYDLSGNRTRRTLNGVTTTYSTAGNSNRLMTLTGGQSKAYVYDAMGNITSDGTLSYGYDNAGRRVWAKGAATTSFAYNALGQRVQKSGPSGTVLYAYDPAGRLIGEYDAGGTPIQETVWLNDIPVLTLRGGAIYYVHADHLNTPRRITRPSDNKPVWAWEAEPFGSTLPDQNPAGLGTFVYNLRMPGQIYDQETGLFYNYYRDYDPNTGKYGQSDPIGLRGGINTYAFVGGNPIKYSDPLGLDRWGGNGNGSGDWTPNGHASVWVPPSVWAISPDLPLGEICPECILLPALRVAKNIYDVLPRQNKTQQCPQETLPLDRAALEKELARLRQVERELRAQLDNGRAQAARELARGDTPNPHGLGREINETIPADIRAVTQRINEISQLLGRP